MVGETKSDLVMAAEYVNVGLLPQLVIDQLADALWARMTGAGIDDIDLNLRAKLALEQRLLPSAQPPFGLDRMTGAETAAYIGVELPTLHDKKKRAALGIPEPYHLGRKLFWRRSELDAWIERQRPRGR